MKIHLLVIISLAGNLLFAQNTSQVIDKEKNSFVFGQIYSDFRYSFKDSYSPRAAFSFNQGIIGYKHQLSDKLTGTIMYDVTRTTHFHEITDTAGIPMNYSYFEGSKYTAYLKMGEIKWKINKSFTFRVGQLLSTQYLTFQDKFWGYRYIDVTFQEKFRLGMPADFGAQLDYNFKNKLVNQFSVVNGEGPFRHQDKSGKFIFSNNIQYYPSDRISLKLYVNYGASPDTGVNNDARSIISGFAGYKTEKFRIGGEYTYIINYGFTDGNDYNGFSVFGSAVINTKLQLLARYDHLNMTIPVEEEFVDYYLLGFQYEPVKKFMTSINFRYFSIDELPFIFANFGLKF